MRTISGVACDWILIEVAPAGGRRFAGITARFQNRRVRYCGPSAVIGARRCRSPVRGMVRNSGPYDSRCLIASLSPGHSASTSLQSRWASSISPRSLARAARFRRVRCPYIPWSTLANFCGLVRVKILRQQSSASAAWPQWRCTIALRNHSSASSGSSEAPGRRPGKRTAGRASIWWARAIRARAYGRSNPSAPNSPGCGSGTRVRRPIRAFDGDRAQIEQRKRIVRPFSQLFEQDSRVAIELSGPQFPVSIPGMTNGDITPFHRYAGRLRASGRNGKPMSKSTGVTPSITGTANRVDLVSESRWAWSTFQKANGEAMGSDLVSSLFVLLA